MKDVNIIKRKVYLDEIRHYYDSSYIKVITGIRRCGKSEFLKQIIQELLNKGVALNKIIKIDLENKEFINVRTGKQLLKILDNKIQKNEFYYVFIDEIQHIKRFEETIAAIRVSYNCSLFVTGSNSKLLKGKLQHRLTGRTKEFEIKPFTYSEVIEYKKMNNIQIDTNTFNDYVKWGGMPQRFQELNERKTKQYLEDLYYSIINKDIIDITKNINKERFLSLSKYILSTTGKIFSALSLAKYLKQQYKIIDVKSLAKNINNQANKLIECYFIRECFPFDFSTKQSIKGLRKFYAVDLGIRNALGNPIKIDDTFGLENLIYNELISRGYEVFYGRNRSKEIDFVVVNGNKKCLIQVAYYLNSKQTFDREFESFKGIKENCPKYVFSLDPIDSSHNGITHINILDFVNKKVDINFS